MSARSIQIVDIGNTHTKFATFQVGEIGFVDLDNFYQVDTPRDDPNDLLSVIQDGLRINDGTLMINSFSGAFIYGDKWYFADKDVPPFVFEGQFGEVHECEYAYTGQNHQFGLVGFPALLNSITHRASKPPESPHGWVLRQLFGVPPHWDLTHASRSGVYHLEDRRWCELPEDLYKIDATDQLRKCPVYSPGHRIFKTTSGLNVLVGGLDHSFVSSYLRKAYVASVTWCNIVQAEPFFNPKTEEAEAGIRWGILADGRYAKELVFPVDRSDENTFQIIKKALPMMHFTNVIPLTGGSADKVRPILEDYSLFEGKHPNLEIEAAAYYAWRCSL